MNCNSSLEAIGKRIAEQREKSNLTQAELAQKISVNRELISYWENGTRDIKTGNIALLAETLNTTCDYLIRGVETENVDIAKTTGLCNFAVNKLREISNFCPSANPLLLPLNAFLTSEELMHFLALFSDTLRAFELVGGALSVFENSLQETESIKSINLKQRAEEIVNRDDDADHPCYTEAFDVIAEGEQCDYDLFLLQKSMGKILDECAQKMIDGKLYELEIPYK